MSSASDLKRDGKMDWFFQEWLYNVTVPRYKFDFTLTDADGGKCILKATVTQSEVNDTFLMPVPLYVDFDGRRIAPRHRRHARQFHQQGNQRHLAQAPEARHAELLARYTRSPIDGHRSPAATGALRRHHDRDGRHRRLGHFHQSLCGRAAGPHAVSDSRRLAARRRAGPARRFHLGGTGDAPARTRAANISICAKPTIPPSRSFMAGCCCW